MTDPVSLAVTGEAPPGTVTVQFGCSLKATSTTGVIGAAYFDDLVAVEAPEVPEFFDGDSPGAHWSGPRFASTSVLDEVGEPDPATLSDMAEWVPPYFLSRAETL